MRQDARATREDQIAEAAYAVLAEKGFGGLTMLAVAKRARASNETLYRWYGDKLGLFAMLIDRNAALVADRLDASLAARDDPRAALRTVAPVLLDMLIGDRAIALNRAAAADASNSLGAVLAEQGRGTVFPRIVGLFEQLVAKGILPGPAPAQATLWIDLLVGDWQVRCVTGAMTPPDAQTRAARVARANALVERLADLA